MAIKYYHNPEKKQTIAVMSNTAYDFYYKIEKLMRESGFVFNPRGGINKDKYVMPDVFKVVVTCDPRDEYDEKVGEQVAKKKLMKNYYRSMDKRIAMFIKSVESLPVTMKNALGLTK